jgi:hypothetical protein
MEGPMTEVCRYGVYIRGVEGGERLVGTGLYEALEPAVDAASALSSKQDIECYVRAIPHAFRPALQSYMPEWQQSYICWSGSVPV